MITKALLNKINIHHIVFTVINVATTESFYTKIFGKPTFKNSQTVMYQIGQTILVYTQKDVQNPLIKKFDPTVIGLEHLAFGISSLEELQQIEKILSKNKIENSGIHIDTSSKKEKIWVNDPSNIRVEFYL